MYSLRRMAIQKLDRTTVTESAKRLSVGHTNTSSSINRRYLSRCNVIDIQGLVQNNKELKSRIMLHGIRRVKAVAQRPSTLDAAAREAIDPTNMVKRLICELNEATNAAKQALAESLVPQECQALLVEWTKRQQRLRKVCCIPRRSELGRVSSMM